MDFVVVFSAGTGDGFVYDIVSELPGKKIFQERMLSEKEKEQLVCQQIQLRTPAFWRIYNHSMKYEELIGYNLHTAKALFRQYNEVKVYTDGRQKFRAMAQEIEKADVHIPDIPASVFGELLGSIFAFQDIENKALLYDFGCALGKFIYIMDAAVDLKSDLKKKRYNPLVRYSSADTEKILEMLIAECVEKYKALNVKQDREIIENILFSGVWMKYPARKERKEK